MALGRRTHKQGQVWVPTHKMPTSPGHPFYRKLNELLKDIEFDRKAARCTRASSTGASTAASARGSRQTAQATASQRHSLW